MRQRRKRMKGRKKYNFFSLPLEDINNRTGCNRIGGIMAEILEFAIFVTYRPPSIYFHRCILTNTRRTIWYDDGFSSVTDGTSTFRTRKSSHFPIFFSLSPRQNNRIGLRRAPIPPRDTHSSFERKIIIIIIILFFFPSLRIRYRRCTHPCCIFPWSNVKCQYVICLRLVCLFISRVKKNVLNCLENNELKIYNMC